MQFGKLVGILLIVLGLILISIQAWSSAFSPQLHPDQNSPQVQQHSYARRTPGVIGGIVTIVGLVVFASNRRKNQDIPRNPVK